MKQFSDYGKKVDKEVEKHMKIIVEEIKKEVKDVVSVLAIGGLGRGEGSFLIEKGKVVPLNDYDIYLITKKLVNFEKLKKISEKATKKIKKDSKFSFSKASSKMEFYIDLRNLTFNNIKKVPSMVKYYEIKNSAKIIYGRDVRKDMPEISLKEIPLEDGLRFLINRASLLIESFDIDNLNSEEARKTINYYIIKNYLTFAEALLLLNQKFVCSYKKRAEIFDNCFKKDFPELYKKIPNLPEKIRKFTEQKLRPQKNFLFQDPTKNWLEARRDFLIIANFYLEKAFELKSNTPIELSNSLKKLNNKFLSNYIKIEIKSKFGISFPKFFTFILSFPGRIYFNYLYFKRNLSLTKEKNFKILFSNQDINLRIYSLAPLVLFSLNNNLKINKKIFESAKKNISNFKKRKIENWNQLRELYADIFRIYQFLKA